MEKNELVKGYLFYSLIFLIPILKFITPVLLISAWTVFRYHTKFSSNASSIFLAHLGNAVKICIELFVTLLVGFIVLSMSEFTEERDVRPVIILIAGVIFLIAIVRGAFKTFKGLFHVYRNCSPFNNQKITSNKKPELMI